MIKLLVIFVAIACLGLGFAAGIGQERSIGEQVASMAPCEVQVIGNKGTPASLNAWEQQVRIAVAAGGAQLLEVLVTEDYAVFVAKRCLHE